MKVKKAKSEYCDVRSQNSITNNQISETSDWITKNESDSLETKEGWILKLSVSRPRVVGWQKRYWVIKSNRIVLFESDNKDKVNGVIDFNLLTWKITVNKDISSQNWAGKCKI